jgi:CRP-like cAMP-binding protein
MARPAVDLRAASSRSGAVTAPMPAAASTGKWTRDPETRPINAIDAAAELDTRKLPRIDLPGYELADIELVSQPFELVDDGSPDPGFLDLATGAGAGAGVAEHGDDDDEDGDDDDRHPTNPPLDRDTERELGGRRAASEPAARPTPTSMDVLPAPLASGGAKRGIAPVRPRVTRQMGSVDPDRVALPSELLPYQRSHRLLDLAAEPSFAESNDEPDEVTDRRDTTSPAPPPEVTMAPPELDEDEPPEEEHEDTDVRAVVPSRTRRTRATGDGLALEQAFQRPFVETLRSLGPDNSTIEAPLAIFSVLPEDALNDLSRQMLLRHYDPGQILVQEGEIGEACYVIATGEVRILKRDPTSQIDEVVEVARLGDGAMFGEFALLADRRRHATVQATTSCEVYEIPRRLLRELAATYPDVGPILERFYRERLLSTLLTTAPFFQPLPEERRADLLARFRPLRSESGQQLVREGEHAGGFYLILLGSVEITKRVADKRSVLLATLGEGAYFGEMSLLRGHEACASVTSVGPSELAVLPPRDFYEVVADNPKLWAEIQREVERRAEMNQIVTGQSGMV